MNSEIDSPPSCLKEGLKFIYHSLVQARPARFRQLLEHLLTNRAWVAQMLQEGDNASVLDNILPDKMRNNHPRLAAFHYTSPRLGSWFRILLRPKERNLADLSVLTPLELHQHEVMYDEAPQEINIPMWRTLLKPLCIKFGGEDWTDKPDGMQCVHLKGEDASKLAQFFTKLEARRFYRLAMGLEDRDWEKVDGGRYEDTPPAETIECVLGANHEYVLSQLRDLPSPIAPPKHDDTPANTELAKKKFDLRLLVSFAFSFFFAIRDRRVSAGAKLLYTLVIPIRGGTENLEEDLCKDTIYKMGAFVGNYAMLPTLNVTAMTRVLERIASVLRSMELDAMREGQSFQRINFLEENVIRSCAVLDESVQETHNLYRKLLNEDDWGLKGITNDMGKQPREIGDLLDMTGCDPVMQSVMRQIKYHAGNAVKMKDGVSEFADGRTLFLYSEPGCGKERLAALYGCLSPRYLRGKEFQWARAAFAAKIRGLLGTKPAGVPDAPIAVDKTIDRIVGMLEPADSERSNIANQLRILWENDLGTTIPDATIIDLEKALCRLDRLPNYLTMNAGLIDAKTFDEVLCGSAEQPGVLLRAHNLCGVVFLDEINTIDSGGANKLLRVLESPYQIVIGDGKPDGKRGSVQINVQIVFGSNKSPDELIEGGMNPAVVSRIAKNVIRVPPLRERKGDIALFVNQQLCKRSREAPENMPCLERLRRISLEGLRLICELPWRDNYRGVLGLLDDILEDRTRRKVPDSAGFRGNGILGGTKPRENSPTNRRDIENLSIVGRDIGHHAT